MVADDVLVQAKTQPFPQTLLHIASNWNIEMDSRCTVPNCVYLQVEEGRVEVTLCGKPLKEGKAVSYLGITLEATGLKGTNSAERAKKGGRDFSLLISQLWWSLDVPPGKFAAMFNTCVRSTNLYGLVVLGVSKKKSNGRTRDGRRQQ